MSQRSLYTVVLLSICLGGFVHLVAGNVGSFDAYNSLYMIEHEESHDHEDHDDHEDDFTLLTTASFGATALMTMQTTANHSPDSRAVLPLLPPPKAA